MSKRWWIGFSCLVIGGLLLMGRQVSLAEVDCSGKAGEPLYECLGRQIEDLAGALAQSRAATAPLEAEVSKLDKQIKSIRAQITTAEKKQKDLEVSIKEREDDLATQYILLGQKLKEYYKQLRLKSDLAFLLSKAGSGKISRELGYREVTASKDREMIVALSSEITGLEQDKIDLEKSKKSLAALQISLDKQAEFFRGEISGAKAFQSSLEGKIASLTSLQQSVLNQKQDTFQTAVGDVPLADDAASRPDYNPGFSPAFALFSFGAPHFKGMSQYGAYGRAQSGQNEEQILKAYYGNVRIESVDTGGNINTSAGAMSMEDRYLMGLAEMPSGWDANNLAALKAQAIAARSYAMAYVGWRMGSRSMGGSICTTESCQVWSSSKAASTPENWRRAVQETRGKILVSNTTNEIISAMYASTSGGHQDSYTSLGHATPAMWDTASGRGGWTSEAYEKKAGSPWFYKAWYRSRTGDSCGKSHPWLTSEEMADILNAWVVIVQKGQSDDRVTPQGSCWGGNPYSIAELRSRADSLGGGYSSVSGAGSVTYSDGGYTETVTFQTNRGSVTIKGSELKKAFNLRAPGRLALKSGLFNVEKK